MHTFRTFVRIILAMAVLSGTHKGFAQAEPVWLHQKIGNENKIGPSPELPQGVSVRISFTKELLNSKMLAHHLFIDLYGIPASVCNSIHVLLTNRTPNPQDRFNGFRERIAVDLNPQPEGHCSVAILKDGRFVDDVQVSRNGTFVGSDYDFVLDEGAKTQQTVSINFGHVIFVGQVFLNDALQAQ